MLSNDHNDAKYRVDTGTFDAMAHHTSEVSFGKDHETSLLAEMTRKRDMTKPLDHIKILDLSRTLAGPFCTMLLGDMGGGHHQGRAARER